MSQPIHDLPAGARIPGSKYVRVYCGSCGEPGRTYPGLTRWTCPDCGPNLKPIERMLDLESGGGGVELRVGYDYETG